MITTLIIVLSIIGYCITVTKENDIEKKFRLKNMPLELSVFFILSWLVLGWFIFNIWVYLIKIGLIP
jgi:hypothetical protein